MSTQCNSGSPHDGNPSKDTPDASLDGLFGRLREAINSLELNGGNRKQILSRLEDLAAAQGSPLWMQSYAQLMVAAGEHTAMLGFLLKPLLRRLSGQ